MSLKLNRTTALVGIGTLLLTAASSTLFYCATIEHLKKGMVVLSGDMAPLHSMYIYLGIVALVGVVECTIGAWGVGDHLRNAPQPLFNSEATSTFLCCSGIAIVVSAATGCIAAGMAEQLVIPNLEVMMTNAYIAAGVLAAVGAVCLIGAFALYNREKMTIAKLNSNLDDMSDANIFVVRDGVVL